MPGAVRVQCGHPHRDGPGSDYVFEAVCFVAGKPLALASAAQLLAVRALQVNVTSLGAGTQGLHAALE